MSGSLRRIVPTALAVAALAVAVTGTAVAANGHAIRLGKTNHATTVTTLSNPNGTSLKLASRGSSPPLTVGGNSTQVPSLNVALLGGLLPGSYGDNAVVLTKPGTFTITVPAGFHHAIVTVRGGGGGGGAAGTVSGETAGSGGQGGLAVAWLPVKPGETFTGVVGAGGTAATTADGGDAGPTTIRPTNVITGINHQVWIVQAAGGAGGEGPTDCPSVELGGAGGGVDGPTASIAALGAVGLQASPGDRGQPASCALLAFATIPTFAFPHVAGSGGTGGTAGGNGAQPGSSGYVSMQFFF